MTTPTERPSTTVLNYTETRRIDRRLYQIGDVRIPFAPTFRAVGFCLAYFLIEIVIFKIVGFEFSMSADRVWFWVLPPPILALFTANIRLQGKSFLAFFGAQARYVQYRLRYWGTAKTQRVRVVVLLWSPQHPAYEDLNSSSQRRYVQ